MQWLRRIVGIALIAVVLVGGWKFAAENAAEVTISYVLGSLPPVALWAALLGAFASGLVVAGLYALLANTRLRLVARRYRKAVHGLESEVHQLRNLPLSTEEPPPDPAAAPESVVADAGGAPAAPPGPALERGA